MGLESDSNKTSYFIEFKVMYNNKINPIQVVYKYISL